jgi:hypothetical protein
MSLLERIALVFRPRLFPNGKCRFCGERPNDNLSDLGQHLLKHPKLVTKELSRD